MIWNINFLNYCSSIIISIITDSYPSWTNVVLLIFTRDHFITISLVIRVSETMYWHRIKQWWQWPHPLRHLPGSVPLLVDDAVVDVRVGQQQLQSLSVVAVTSQVQRCLSSCRGHVDWYQPEIFRYCYWAETLWNWGLGLGQLTALLHLIKTSTQL